MRILFFETKPGEKRYFKKALAGHKLFFSPLEAEEFSTSEVKSTDTSEMSLAEEAAKEAEVLSVFIYSNLTASVLALFPKLKLIVTRSTGTDHIDLKECKRRKIGVKNVPEYGTNTVAEHTWALLLSLTRKIYQSVDQIKEEGSFSLKDLSGRDVFGKTFGIVGCGKIGKRVGELGRAFGCNIIAFDPYCTASDLAKLGFLKAGLPDLYKQSDMLSFHAPLTRETTHILSRKDVQYLKKGVFIVNTARGGLIETKALLDGLQQGIIAGVGLDVLEQEEEIREEAELLENSRLNKEELKIMVENHILFKDKRVIVTPHNAFNSKEALERIMETTVENITVVTK
jgi:D-lactate dehydrogenase